MGALVFNALSAASTSSQIEVTRQGQVTERFSKAVEHLGSAGIDVRLGGVYALGRVMRDSPPDQASVVEVLSAFVRNKAGTAADSVADAPAARAAVRQPGTDMKAALSVLARRNPKHDAPGQRTDLTRTNLSGFDLRGMDLHDADLGGADLRGANLRVVNLSGADLGFANLTGADLLLADLRGAQAFGAKFTDARLDDAHLENARLLDLTGAHVNEGTTGLQGRRP
ncbi:pentapeptide repeat-containing protein [Streptomyces sp. TLI_146]|uniref:pentapeptide repeat-containing protein n=1 Tax=Streptomyces sp. TLI_146 TaxID=1938858 RepID=UPI0015D64676|nr:pentapeptide repeat-containing protein [Streptomyces sp. TLI_146]